MAMMQNFLKIRMQVAVWYPNDQTTKTVTSQKFPANFSLLIMNYFRPLPYTRGRVPPLRQVFFVFMPFLVKNGQII